MFTKTCTYCKKTFETKYRLATLCCECRYGPCEVCGETFKRQVREGKRLQRFCSRECVAVAQNWKPETQEQKCVICEQAFTVERGDWERKTCSDECLYELRSINATELMMDYHLENSTELECEWCHSQFRRRNSHIFDHVFCSTKCYGKWQSSQGEGLITRTCKTCGKKYQVKKTQVRHRGSNYCSQECHAKGLSEIRKGSNNPNWSHKLSKFCPVCGDQFWVNPSNSKRVTCSAECSYQHRSQVYRGKRHWLWRGGSIPYYGSNWCEQRRKARRRDNYECQACGATSPPDKENCHVHHIIPLRKYDGDWKSANKLCNLITLCRSCHSKVEHELIDCPIPK